MYAEALAIFQRYLLHSQHGITYSMQGYALDATGTLSARMIDEHVLCHRFYQQAVEDSQ